MTTTHLTCVSCKTEATNEILAAWRIHLGTLVSTEHGTGFVSAWTDSPSGWIHVYVKLMDGSTTEPLLLVDAPRVWDPVDPADVPVACLPLELADDSFENWGRWDTSSLEAS